MVSRVLVAKNNKKSHFSQCSQRIALLRLQFFSIKTPVKINNNLIILQQLPVSVRAPPRLAVTRTPSVLMCTRIGSFFPAFCCLH